MDGPWPVDRRRQGWKDFPRDVPHRMQSEDASVVESKLTPRQRDVMALTAEGLTFREIGEVLGMSPQTARTHQQNALLRLRAHNLAHGVALLLRRGEIL